MFDSLSHVAQEETTTIEVSTPAGEPILFTVDGKDIRLTLTLMSKDCDAAVKLAQSFQNKVFRTMSKARGGASKFDQAENSRKQDLEMAVACTADWNLHDKGQPLPSTPGNIRALYEDKRFPFILAQVKEVIADRAEFEPPTDDDSDSETESGN